jgi:hypothetical protein
VSLVRATPQAESPHGSGRSRHCSALAAGDHDQGRDGPGRGVELFGDADREHSGQLERDRGDDDAPKSGRRSAIASVMYTAAAAAVMPSANQMP